MITIPSLSEVYDIADTDVVMVTNNNGNTFKLSGAEVNRRNQVIIADSKTITGSPLKTGRIVRVYFTVTLTASNTTDPLILKYNNTNITVKIAKDGSLSNYVAFSVDSTYKYLQAYTTLELLYNGTNFVVMGNPVVLSSASYTIFANATIHKADVGLGSVVNTGDSATPVSGGTTKFTTGGAYTELAKKVNTSAIGTAAAKTAGSAAGNVPLVGTALGTTDGNIVATNGSGALKPGGITVANMQAIGTTIANCTTGASTAAKTATLSGFRLVNPSMIYVKIGTTNSASSPTLNVNSTGAKTIKLNGAAVSSTNQLAAGTYLAMYDGTYWNLLPYGIADAVSAGNMQSVSSDAVYKALGSISSIDKSTGTELLKIYKFGRIVILEAQIAKTSNFSSPFYFTNLVPDAYKPLSDARSVVINNSNDMPCGQALIDGSISKVGFWLGGGGSFEANKTYLAVLTYISAE